MRRVSLLWLRSPLSLSRALMEDLDLRPADLLGSSSTSGSCAVMTKPQATWALTLQKADSACSHKEWRHRRLLEV
jgi:hypothetical protein